jgi:Icc-related predicted phosphoesterase
MKIVTLTDLHAKKNLIPLLAGHLREASLVLLCGDITHFGKGAEMAEIVGQLAHYNPNIFAVSGNCDHPAAELHLVSAGISLNATIKQFNKYTLVGLSGSLPCPGKTPNEYTDEEYDAILGALDIPAKQPLIFVSHQPPFNTLNDQVSPGFHVGSKSIRQFIEMHQPLICFTGHIHEGIGIDTIGQTRIVNPGPAGAGNFAIAELEKEFVKNIELRNLFSEKAI